MSDREFLIWIHARLSSHYGDSELLDFMRRLRAIILSTPKDRTTESAAICNGHEDLMRLIDEIDNKGTQ